MINVIFGYGNIGKLVADDLRRRGEGVVVARHSASSKENTDSITVDILDASSVEDATKGCDRLIITTGLPYKLSVWQQEWPVIVDNMIAAAKVNGCRIVFFDNIYLYGPSPLQNPITENHPRSPSSRKGAVRLTLVEKLEQAMADGVPVLIVRSADFYGPDVTNSGINLAIDSIAKGKTGYFMGDPKTRHAYSYVPDISKAVVMLALADDTYNQTWHLPTSPAVGGISLMKLVSDKLPGAGKWSVMGTKSMLFIGLFVPIIRELREMMYQFNYDYIFDCSKFSQRFPDFQITTYKDGIAATVTSQLKQFTTKP